MRAKQLILILFFPLLLISCQQKKAEKPKYLWICVDANFERFSRKDSICFYLDKAKEVGFNAVVVDVKGVDGYVAYKSKTFPMIEREGDFAKDDYLQYFIDQAHKRDLKVHISESIFTVGNLFRQRGPVFDDPEIAAMTCLEHTPNGFMKIEDEQIKVAAFLNPALPQSREYAMRAIREVFEGYKFDAFCLDYCRYPDAQSDFSQASREAFENYLGQNIEHFPEDIFSYSEAGERIPGPYYKEWWTWRAKVIHDFIADVKALRDEIAPKVKLEYWAASWLHAIYVNGQNWASSKSRFYEEYDWATDDYYQTALADLLDVFITGTYLNRVWGMGDLESIEYGIYRTNRDVDGACEVHGSLYAQNHRDQFEDAVYLSLSRTSGLMIFDIVQVIRYNLWDDIKAGIDRAEAEE